MRSDLMKMYHPSTKQTAVVGVRAFELVWSKKGWKPAPDDDATPDTKTKASRKS